MYVINLKRRLDRKNNIENKFQSLDYQFVEAVDGSEQSLPQNDYLHNKNDYHGNPRISATILSHCKVWELIASTGGVNPKGVAASGGVIFEDDINLHPNFKSLWDRIYPKIRNTKGIVYLGLGDFLPIHTNCPFQSLLEAQERAHIVKGSQRGVLGKPNTKSSYVFDWFGAFSYYISTDTAKQLLGLAKTQKIGTALDVWLKDSPIPKYCTVPLLAYHNCIDKNIYDSDTWGITRPIQGHQLGNTYKTLFLLPLYTKNIVNYDPQILKDTLQNLVDNSKYPMAVSILLDYDSPEKDIVVGFKEKMKIYTVFAKIGDMGKHEMYNTLSRTETREYDFVAIWELGQLVNENWDDVLYKYYEVYNRPTFASFQIQSNIEQNCDTLNKGSNLNNIYKNPILTSDLIQLMDHISIHENVTEYLKYITYLSKINIVVKDINTRSNLSRINEDYEGFFHHQVIKTKINKMVLGITKNPKYKPCGIWVPHPTEWDQHTTIDQTRLSVRF